MRDIKETTPVRVYLLRPLVRIPEGNRAAILAPGSLRDGGTYMLVLSPPLFGIYRGLRVSRSDLAASLFQTGNSGEVPNELRL
jgi:hypothetical protein